MIQAIFDSNPDTADFFFIVAMIVFIIATVMCVLEKGWVLALISAGLASMALAWLFLT
jgi:hypothetical protein